MFLTFFSRFFLLFPASADGFSWLTAKALKIGRLVFALFLSGESGSTKKSVIGKSPRDEVFPLKKKKKT